MDWESSEYSKEWKELVALYSDGDEPKYPTTTELMEWMDKAVSRHNTEA